MPRGRPRDAQREQAVLDATLAVLEDVGYEALTLTAVARRAGASTSTIYRRWVGKRELVAAAAAARSPAPSVAVDTGSLSGDLLALCQLLRDTLVTTRGRTVLALLAASSADPPLGDLIEDLAGTTGARLPATVLHRAVRRGELPADADPFAFDEVTGATLVLRALNGHRLDDDYLRDLVDRVLLPALQHVAAAPGLARGFFRPDAAPPADDDTRGSA